MELKRGQRLLGTLTFAEHTVHALAQRTIRESGTACKGLFVSKKKQILLREGFDLSEAISVLMHEFGHACQHFHCQFAIGTKSGGTFYEEEDICDAFGTGCAANWADLQLILDEYMKRGGKKK